VRSDKQIINSALWSAYGDALGFITELADEGILKKRSGVRRITKLQDWNRLIGGFNGAEVCFPAGTYSDDTQLRLAVSRSINGAGYFDIEAFAKVELTVWLSYCLGAGRGTKNAASNLLKSDVNWFSNFYKVNQSSYFDSGGNGVVMRIQPHVWSAGAAPDRGLLLDIFKNSISTHGHPRALVGACFHALFLLEVLDKNEIPDINSWEKICNKLRVLAEVASDDLQIATFWIPMWEENTKAKFSDAIDETIDELIRDIYNLISIYNGGLSTDRKYTFALEELGGFDESQRGSGTKTAIFASFLSALFPNSPEQALTLCVNCLGSDTDTIATVAGAILGVICDRAPPERIQDQNYIEKESLRLVSVGLGVSEYEFKYPDLYSWKAPKNLTESLVMANDDISILGLGRARIIGKNEIVGKNSKLQWIWAQVAFGQSFLVRFRKDPRTVEKYLIGGYIDKKLSSSKKKVSSLSTASNILNEVNHSNIIENEKPKNSSQYMSIEELVALTMKENFDPNLIGKNLITLINKGAPIEEIVSYVSMLTYAKRK
jgi:ADP-ribosylglycohydrolase